MDIEYISPSTIINKALIRLNYPVIDGNYYNEQGYETLGKLWEHYCQACRLAITTRHWHDTTKILECKSSETDSHGRYMFKLPDDCLRIFEVTGDGTEEWRTSGRYIYADNPVLTLKYGANIVNFPVDAEQNLIESIISQLVSIIHNEQLRAKSV